MFLNYVLNYVFQLCNIELCVCIILYVVKVYVSCMLKYDDKLRNGHLDMSGGQLGCHAKMCLHYFPVIPKWIIEVDKWGMTLFNAVTIIS